MNTQFKKGVLELCALTLLTNGDMYGYALAEKLGKKLNVSEGTVYPMLKRLLNDKYFDSYLRESPNGPARKYYRITLKGRERQEVLQKEWSVFYKEVNSFLEEAVK